MGGGGVGAHEKIIKTGGRRNSFFSLGVPRNVDFLFLEEALHRNIVGVY